MIKNRIAQEYPPLYKNNSEQEYNNLFNDVFKSMISKSLFIVIGAGVSIKQLYPDWNQYVDSLINFWTYNLDLVRNIDPECIKKEVDLSDINFLKMLAISNLSNKRKVDLVHHVIQKYCETPDPNKSKHLFRKYGLKFEKKFFLEYNPLISSNEILQYLVQLDPIFITTNYDQEIEKALKPLYPYSTSTVHDFSQISKEVARPDSVLHIHGTPTDEVDFDLFISSSNSYSRIYYCNDSYKIRFREIFSQRKDSVVLFVGCSMEEEEVLSLFDFNSTDIKYYSLMKYNTNDSNENLQSLFNKTIKDYYSYRNLNFIWYGECYKDLDGFTKSMVDRLLELEKQSKTPPDKFRDILLGKDI